MKGIVFTEFLEMVDDRFGIEITEEIISKSDTLTTGGSYTAVGTYPHGELVGMVIHLSKKTGIAPKDLLVSFGEYMFVVLSRAYPALLEHINGLFDFLSKIDDYIHVEVRKLYPEAELPRFDTEKGEDENELVMLYSSERAMSDFGVGLIIGASDFFNEKVEVKTEDVSDDSSGKHVKIRVRKIG